MNKLAIVGSRTFNNYDLLSETVLDHIDIQAISHIISGGAKGADSLAEQFASNWDIPTIIFKPDWNKYGRGAGMIRNKQIISESDIVIAFWDGVSKGTKNSIDTAVKLNKNLIVVRIEC